VRRAGLESRAGAALLAAAMAAGCAAVGRNVTGSVPAPAAVGAVEEGASVGDVLARLGAPLEYWLAPDGMLLIWRRRHYDYERLELDPSQGLSFLSVDPVVGTVLSNLKVILERGHASEDRIAVLFDGDGRVIAVAARDREGQRIR
jgi:hypothetical protein